MDSTFPRPGSFALYIDGSLPIDRQRPELVQVLRRFVRGTDIASVIVFRLRRGEPTAAVPEGDLIDGTPLTHREKRDLADYDRLAGRRARRAVLEDAGADALRQRAIWAPMLERRMAELLQAAA